MIKRNFIYISLSMCLFFTLGSCVSSDFKVISYNDKNYVSFRLSSDMFEIDEQSSSVKAGIMYSTDLEPEEKAYLWKKYNLPEYVYVNLPVPFNSGDLSKLDSIELVCQSLIIELEGIMSVSQSDDSTTESEQVSHYSKDVILYIPIQIKSYSLQADTPN